MPEELGPGEIIGGRYRLERRLGRGHSSDTWEAFDERLDRPVALRFFGSDEDRRALMKRAGLAASLTHPRAVRVFDTGFDGGRFFTVSELLGGSLRTARLPLVAKEAVGVAIGVAEGLQHAHERGVFHGHLTESNVLLGSGGAKVGDFALSRDRPGEARADLCDLGTMLRRVRGVKEGPVPDDPPGFARIVEGLADGAYDSAPQVLRDLRAIGVSDASGRTLRAAPRPPWWLAVAAIILAAGAIFALTRLGSHSPQSRLSTGGKIRGTPLRIVGVQDFDPFGDGHEGHRTIHNIADGDPNTFWATESYRSSANFSGLKPGAGIILDLGGETEVGKAQLLLPAPGCSLEIRYSNDGSASVDHWGTAATLNSSPKSAPLIFQPVKARYWLLWITRLTTGVPGAAEGYACAISEASLFAP
jgi:serine/threonine protein kinase